MTVKNPSITLDKTEATVVVNGTEKFTASTRPKSAASTVAYTTSDEKVATVAGDGTVNGVAAGEATITASAKCGSKTVTATAKVTVKKIYLSAVKQSRVDQIIATVTGDTKDLKATDFTITNTATNATVPVKNVTVDKTDKTKVTIDTFSEMKDAKEYNVVLDGVTQKFTATDGTVANVGLTKTQIPAAEKTLVKAQSLDANGVVIGEFDITNQNVSKGQVSTELTITKGSAEATGIYLPAVGDTMTAKLTYHTGTFGTDGNETGKIEQTFTITAVDPSMVNYNFQVTISGSTPAWTATSFKANTDVKIGEPRNAYFRILKDDGTEVSNYNDYTVATADRTKLLVTDTKLTNSTKAVPVNGVSEGLTYIEIQKDGKVVGTVSVNVKAKPVATTLDLDKTTVTVARGVSTVTEKATATIKDQYNDNMSIDASSAKIECIGAPDDTSKANANQTAALPKVTVTGNKATIEVNGNRYGNEANCAKGSYTYKLSLKNGDKELTRSFTVSLVETAAVDNYELKFSQNKVDTTIGTGTVTQTDFDITVDVVGKGNGAAIDKISNTIPVKYTVKDQSNKTIAVVGKNPADGDAVSATTCAAISSPTVSNNQLEVDVINVTPTNNFKKNLGKGTYIVTAEFYSDYDAGTKKNLVQVSGNFVIEDTQDTHVTYKLLKNDFGTKSITDGFKDPTLVEVYYDGVRQTIANVDSVDATILSNGGAFVKTVSLYVKVTGSGEPGNYVCVTVPINDQLAKCNGK